MVEIVRDAIIMEKGGREIDGATLYHGKGWKRDRWNNYLWDLTQAILNNAPNFQKLRSKGVVDGRNCARLYITEKGGREIDEATTFRALPDLSRPHNVPTIRVRQSSYLWYVCIVLPLKAAMVSSTNPDSFKVSV